MFILLLLSSMSDATRARLFDRIIKVRTYVSIVSVVVVASESHGGQTEQDQNLHCDVCMVTEPEK